MQPSLASVPGALVFRALLTAVAILILILVFFSYVDRTQRAFERNSIQQTERIIDGSLAVVFATYATSQRLNDLNELDGANPFDFLQLPPLAYRGEVEGLSMGNSEPGWYYLRDRGLVAYKAFHLDSDIYFRVRLKYRDVNNSGRFEAASDEFQNLKFIRIVEMDR